MAAITFTERERRNGDLRHGTITGAARHAAAGEDPCPDCRAAKAAYDAEYRSTPEHTRRNRMHAKAQRLALRDLKDAHPDEYREAYLRHKKELIIEHIREPDARPTPPGAGDGSAR